MDLQELKESVIISKINPTDDAGRILSLIDFGNVNYWFENDRFNCDGNSLNENEKLNVDIAGIYNFCRVFSLKSKFYYGLDNRQKKSIHLIRIARENFGKASVVTKHIQYIKHYLEETELNGNTRSVNFDKDGKYVYIKKCNFDIEICIDAIALSDYYDTLCLFSGDADFANLLRYLKETKKKKLVLIKGGHASRELTKQADLIINAQDIKKYITFIKQKSRR